MCRLVFIVCLLFSNLGMGSLYSQGDLEIVQVNAASLIWKNPKPNIILILVDDLGYGDLGCYGQQTMRTPNLDLLAQEGVRFMQCYSGSPVCAPSRSVLMTGQHTGHTTVRGNNGVGGVVGLGGASGRIPLLPSDTTIATKLKQHGYVTGMVGKWGLGEPGTTGEPHKQGFDMFYGFLNQRRAHTYFPDYIWDGTERLPLEANRSGKDEVYIQDLFANRVQEFIDKHRDTTFFLYYPMTLPHDDYEIPEVGRFSDSLHWTPEEQIYAAMVERMDVDIGRLMKQLNSLSIEDNTLIILCSDNGPAKRWDDRLHSAGVLRGKKRDLYEGGIRVPMIMRWPGKLKANSASLLVTYFADIFPTLCDILGDPPSQNMDGESILIHSNEKFLLRSVRSGSIYWEFYEGGFVQAIRYNQWKCIYFGATNHSELYNIDIDPSEQSDLSSIHPNLVNKLLDDMSRAHTPSIYFQK